MTAGRRLARRRRTRAHDGCTPHDPGRQTRRQPAGRQMGAERPQYPARRPDAALGWSRRWRVKLLADVWRMTTPFSLLLQISGLSHREAADFLGRNDMRDFPHLIFCSKIMQKKN